MKPVLRKSIPECEASFVLRRDVGVSMKNNWHYHPEYELLFIKNSCGSWLIGDYEGPFKSGDVILLGSNIPHSFIHDNIYLGSAANQGESLVALFEPSILGDTFLNLPESADIKNLLKLSIRGLKLTGSTKDEIGNIMDGWQEVSKGRKLINLLTILQIISEKKEYEILASGGFNPGTEKSSNDRLDTVIEYTYYNYHKQITISEVASLINMGIHTFCRFFKEKTKKTYMQFLMEVRIGQACRLLIEDDMHVGEAGYVCGYNSVSHFNHQFKVIKNKSPLEFKRNYFSLINA